MLLWFITCLNDLFQYTVNQARSMWQFMKAYREKSWVTSLLGSADLFCCRAIFLTPVASLSIFSWHWNKLNMTCSSELQSSPSTTPTLTSTTWSFQVAFRMLLCGRSVAQARYTQPMPCYWSFTHWYQVFQGHGVRTTGRKWQGTRWTKRPGSSPSTECRHAKLQAVDLYTVPNPYLRIKD